MKHLLTGLAAVLVFAAECVAQPRVAAVVHSASYFSGHPEDFGIARGSLFVVFGTSLGPDMLQQASSFPLKPDLAGSSIQVEVGGRSFAAPMVYTSSRQVAALLPSATPAGRGTLTATYNQRSGRAVPIQVVESAFGMYTVNQAGRGPAVVTNAAYQQNTSSLSANPGETVILWGSGLGAVSGDESAGPLPGNVFSDVLVLVGTQLAPVRYAGRSGCCAGLDQIAFEVPPGVEGCFVPLAVKMRGKTSNFGSLSIASRGRQCPWEGPIPEAVLEEAQGGMLSLGVIGVGPEDLLSAVMSHVGVRDPATQFLVNLAVRTAPDRVSREAVAQQRRRIREAIRSYKESGKRGKPARLSAGPVQRASTQPEVTAGFSRVRNISPMSAHFMAAISAVNSCSVLTCTDSDCGMSAIFPQGPGPGKLGFALDAGRQLALEGPSMSRIVPRVVAGQYRAALPAGVQGDYSISGPGGADVGAFKATLSIPAELRWTNRDQFLLVDRSQDLTVTWTSGARKGHVVIGGMSGNDSAGAMFLCSADASAGSFTVPSFVLQAMPVYPTAPRPLAPLFVATHPFDNTFSAPGLDLGYFRDVSLDVKRVEYR